MRYLVLAVVIICGFSIGAVVSAYPGEFGTPPAPQNVSTNPAFAHYDVQVHSRNQPWTGFPNTMQAQHGPACEPPPATHPNQSLGGAVFVCADHVMTSLDSGDGYAEAILTPSQLLNCSASCTVQWEVSTERMSARDWPDLWLTPWADNLTLPFDEGDVDLQGVPRQGIHVNLQNGANNSFHASTITNYVQTDLAFNASVGMDQGIIPGTNQAAVRQTFRLTVTPGHIRFERIASATAIGVVWVDTGCACLMAPDYVVQFGHHSYNPTKENSGVPATWHWSGFTLTPSVPFALTHTDVGLQPNGQDIVLTTPGTIHWPTPTPSGAFLRFSGICRVLVDGVMAPRQAFTGFPEHFSSYFVPIAAGKTSVNITFAADAWYGGPCAVQDAAIWAKSGSAPPATPTPVLPTATPTKVPGDVCNQAYFKNHVLTEGPVIPCP